MPSFEELVESNNRGDLGAMLAEQFGGERGRVYPRQDSEFIIRFPSKEQTPSVEQLRRAVVSFYEGLGYVVKMGAAGLSDMLDFFVFCPGGSKEEHLIYGIISTNYPLVMGEGNENIRVTTDVNY